MNTAIAPIGTRTASKAPIGNSGVGTVILVVVVLVHEVDDVVEAAQDEHGLLVPPGVELDDVADVVVVC
jgi:hypothetical protein